MQRPVVVVTGHQRPHEIVFLAFALVVGLAYTLGAPPPQSAAATMPAWLVHTWAVGLFAHGVTGLGALIWPMPKDRSLLVEAGSMLIGAGALVMVAAAAFSYAGWAALLGGGLSLAWATANVVRVVQIRRDFPEPAVNPLTIVASIIGGLGGLGGFAALVTAFARRRVITADAEVRLSDEARQWVEQFQEDAKEARQEAKEFRAEAAAARREATEAHNQMRAIKTEAEWLARRLQELHRAILDPHATLERLRALVGTDPGANGTSA